MNTQVDHAVGSVRLARGTVAHSPDRARCAGSVAQLHFSAPAQPRSVALAREAARRYAGLPEPRGEDLALVVTELFSNAIRHSGLRETELVRMRLAREQRTIKVEVEDRGPGIDPRAARGARAPARRAEGGYGLHIVERLSRRWGVRAGGCVWAELAV
jgi:anti-sigma regulatory factor (Ser/Thr protein kinase)